MEGGGEIDRHGTGEGRGGGAEGRREGGKEGREEGKRRLGGVRGTGGAEVADGRC